MQNKGDIASEDVEVDPKIYAELFEGARQEERANIISYLPAIILALTLIVLIIFNFFYSIKYAGEVIEVSLYDVPHINVKHYVICVIAYLIYATTPYYVKLFNRIFSFKKPQKAKFATYKDALAEYESQVFNVNLTKEKQDYITTFDVAMPTLKPHYRIGFGVLGSLFALFLFAGAYALFTGFSGDVNKAFKQNDYNAVVLAINNNYKEKGIIDYMHSQVEYMTIYNKYKDAPLDIPEESKIKFMRSLELWTIKNSENKIVVDANKVPFKYAYRNMKKMLDLANKLNKIES